MKKQITRLSPHQNGKVFGILMAITSLIFIIPMYLLMSAIPHMQPPGNSAAFPGFMLLAMPLIYLIFGYLSVVLWCIVYNFITKYIGGIEFELEDRIQ